jgi:hypothetical protein
MYMAIFTDWFVPDKYQQQSTVTHSDPAMATTRSRQAGRQAGRQADICQQNDYCRLKKDAVHCSAHSYYKVTAMNDGKNLWGMLQI